jgi:hypothetical protein
MKSLILISLGFISASLHAADPLPSWNYGATKQSITAFVEKVTKEGSPDFIAVAERIATFDNDGTLWSEQPLYFQLFFAMDRIKTLAPQHPEWKDKEPFASLLKGDVKAALAGGEATLAQTVMATHAGLTTEEFEKIVTIFNIASKKKAGAGIRSGNAGEMAFTQAMASTASCLGHSHDHDKVHGGVCLCGARRHHAGSYKLD